MDNLGPFQDWEKPSWDEWCMNIAFAAAMRSPDPATKHGCFIVDKNYHPLGLGYNAFPPNCDDKMLPLTRPEKYDYMIHAEENAMNHAMGSLQGATVYVTGHPCSKCFRDLRAKRVQEVVYGPIGSHCVDFEERDIIRKLNSADGSLTPGTDPAFPTISFLASPAGVPIIRLREYEGEITELMKRTIEYVNIKTNA